MTFPCPNCSTCPTAFWRSSWPSFRATPSSACGSFRSSSAVGSPPSSPTIGSAAARDSTADFMCQLLSTASRTRLLSSLASAAAFVSTTRTGRCRSAFLLSIRFSRSMSFVVSIWPRSSKSGWPSSCSHRDLRPKRPQLCGTAVFVSPDIRESSGSFLVAQLRHFGAWPPVRRRQRTRRATALESGFIVAKRASSIGWDSSRFPMAAGT